MKWEVTYDIANGPRGPGQAPTTSSLLMNRKMTVEAGCATSAQKIVEGMFGPNCHTYGARPVS